MGYLLFSILKLKFFILNETHQENCDIVKNIIRPETWIKQCFSNLSEYLKGLVKLEHVSYIRRCFAHPPMTLVLVPWKKNSFFSRVDTKILQTYLLRLYCKVKIV